METLTNEVDFGVADRLRSEEVVLHETCGMIIAIRVECLSLGQHLRRKILHDEAEIGEHLLSENENQRKLARLLRLALSSTDKFNSHTSIHCQQ